MTSTWGKRFGVVIAVGSIVLNVGLILMADAAFAKGKPIEGPRVVDANNKVVGPVIGLLSISNPVVALNVSIPSPVVQVFPNQFVGNYSLVFTSVDCSGQPYFIKTELDRAHTLPIVGVVNGILYGPRANSPAVPITSNSTLGIVTGTCGVSEFPTDAVIADAIIDLSTQFTPPYRFVYP